MDWYLKALKSYTKFDGRSQRMEYWYFFLVNIVILVILYFIDSMTGMVNAASGYGILSGVYALAVLLPGIAVAVRRFHDTNRTGWWVLVALIPLIGGLILICFMVLDSDPETNKYGPNPKASTG